MKSSRDLSSKKNHRQPPVNMNQSTRPLVSYCGRVQPSPIGNWGGRGNQVPVATEKDGRTIGGNEFTDTFEDEDYEHGVKATSSVQQKHPTTLTEDRTRGGEFERTGAYLVALKDAKSRSHPNSSVVLEGTERQSHPSASDDSLSNPTPDVLNDFDFDSFLHDDEEKGGSFGPSTAASSKKKIPGSTADARQNNPSKIPRSIDASFLGIPEESAISLETLRDYISDLQEKAGVNRRPKPPAIQTIHCVKNGADLTMYIDQPHWIAGESSSREALVGHVPFRNVSSYLGKHPEIIFIVYLEYDVSVIKENSGEDDESSVISTVQHTAETIELTTQCLADTFTKFLQLHIEADLDGVDIEQTTQLAAPYLAVYHSRDTMDAFLKGLLGQQRQQFQLLIDYILHRYGDEYEIVDNLVKRGKIKNSYMKYLFKPGDVLVEGDKKDARGYICESWLSKDEVSSIVEKTGSEMTYEIVAWSWTFDGVFSRERTVLKLSIDVNDDSEKNIDELSIRPVVHTNEDTTRILERRGKMFWKFRVRHLVSYHEDTRRDFHHSGDTRYMIDLKMYRELHKSQQIWHDMGGTDGLGPEWMDQDEPPDDKFVYLLPKMIQGFNLKTKKWLDLRVDLMGDVVWNKEAFESLTYQHPGTGNTLTAESVAETFEKPLYPVTCGDIGTEPEAVERYLESVLTIGKTWGCVVLLDEADVFLAQRSLEDLRRNALVSVFLRVLEYYDGILILTSNRLGTFDEAFKSRIQLALHYESLSHYQRTEVWGNFFRRLERLEEKGIDFDDLKDHVAQLADNKMNGREIRNAITTARQYAKWEKKPLNYELLQDIIETAGQFDKYLKKLNGGYTQDQLAEEEGLRLASARMDSS
ncbi:ATPase family AAA domain-containing protein 3 [Cytospora mali]|uniref:ATPase family AAA domain-containing protein 3 n=1 Tax=Cytospora mali TaxID=578113 RepID=A0A194UUW0_CYTMA|nr:ATPase family AAA domain-containing protein 3 [Valsa mali var. pyri (nom. inval.)]